ncbi:MAG: M28 family peptidase [Gemmatimonadota bacterium]|nr:MAG: M28 family peptidase [Gemmatimonadota bacterium]
MTRSIESVAYISRNQGRPFRRRALLLLALATTCVFIVPGPAVAQEIDPEVLLAHVKYLASDELAGREAGEPGADSAAAYIAKQFESYGLEPPGTESYRQPFEITTTISIAPDSRLLLRSGRGSMTLELFKEWVPFNFSGAGSASGEVSHAGYGLRDEDYEELESREGPGIALLRGGVPEDFDPHGSGVDPSPRRKATAARDAGAEAVLITVLQLRVPQAGDPPHSLGIPAVQIIESEEILAWLEDDDLSIVLEAKVEPLRVAVYNVVGQLPGADPAVADELIVVGAHYDHLGMGGPGSLAPDLEEPHNGADDNASGTALLLGIAQYFAAHPEARPARSLVFVAFSAEEMGLLGSEYFISHAPFPLEKVTAMLNFDMVGRVREGKLQVFGTETAEEFAALLDSLDAASPLALSYVGDGYGPSDQTSFYAREIPVLHLFSGTHSEYHRPEDDWQLINAAGMAEVGALAIGLIRELGERPGALTLIKQERPQARGGGGYGPYLGTVPDFGEVEGGGLRLSGVREGSPADQAGLQGGDVVIEFAGNEVLNIYDYTYALRDHAPGDTVVIKVRREGEVVELTAVLGRRQ